MSTIIELPQVGESVTEGVIGKWLKQPGEHVDKYDPLVEVMTDKVNMEVPSPFTGILIRTLVEEGDTVPMGQPIAEMDVEGGASSEAGNEGETYHSFAFNDAVRSVGPTGSGEGGHGRPDALQSTAAPPVRPARPVSEPGPLAGLSPLVRKLVAQHGVDVAQVTGTGMSGRITKNDVLRFVDSGAPDRGEAEAIADADATTTLALTPLRRTIAEHLSRAASEIPAAWSMVEADVTGLVANRDAHRESFEREYGVPLTYLPFAAHVVAKALGDNPRLNARWAGDHIVLNTAVNLSVAVSTDAGLTVPVVRDAGGLSVTELARRIHELTAAARSGSLMLDDVRDGTFTLNNTGALGSTVSVPIINHPQAAIVTTEAIVKRPVVVGADAIVVRSMMNVCLTFDHRVCDGAEAGAFLRDVKAGLEAIGPDVSLL
jgi:2-oxoisovalerate dehydrogenase E2 component (dihydrolipoyl transacylase)